MAVKVTVNFEKVLCAKNSLSVLRDKQQVALAGNDLGYLRTENPMFNFARKTETEYLLKRQNKNGKRFHSQ